MINKEYEILKELLGKLLDDILDEDIKKGSDMKELCVKYHNKSLVEKKNYCDENKHKEKVLAYIDDIQTRYSNLIRVYNVINGNFPNGTSDIECKNIETCVEFLMRIKNAKQEYDKGSKLENLIKSLRGEKNE